MSLAIDLHSHSTASDGTLSPSALVTRAAAAGVQVLALTDHDTTEGIAEAATAAGRVGIHLVAGVEVSVTWNAVTIHLVGLGVDPEHPTLGSGLAGLREFRDWRAVEIGRRLAKHGISGAYVGALERSNGRLVSRTHFARFLVDSGHERSVREVFGRFLTRGKPGHVPGRWASLEAAVGWIHAAGGMAVLAHPARYPFTRSKLRRLLGELVELGGEGIEVVSGSHSRDDAFTMAQHARDFALRASAGSDYHGPEQAWVELGRLADLPPGCVPIWQDWALAA